MDDQPYTTPDEDPFSVRPLLQPRRRRSSMLDKWIQEQQKLPSSPQSTPRASCNTLGPRGNPYLAYPGLGIPQESRSRSGSVITLGSYDLVDDEDIPQGSIPEIPLSPSTPTSTAHKGFLGTPTSFRSLHNPFRSQSPARSSTPTAETAPRTPSRKPFIPLNSRLGQGSERSKPKQHNRSSSLSILNNPPLSPSTSSHMPEPSPTPSKWRPSVLGYFSSSATSQVSFIPSETLYTPSRPSVSSNSTVTTTTSITSATATAKNNDAPVTTARLPLNSGVASFRLPRRSHADMLHVQSSNSVENNVPNSSYARPSKGGSTRIPLAPKSTVRIANSNVNPIHDDDEERSLAPVHVAKHNAKPEIVFVASSKTNTLSKMSFAALSSKNNKKKRLIISGIASNDVRKFEGVKNWCESFGEVSHIIRMPNNDLHVHFRSADVADTVCRLRARVYIVGCGSVGVSWTTGNTKR
ncbi:hypothetical protein C8R41DRAFT_589352 [Lentinula lateritia]|uniref:RRM Nup35-type domain-containing protein n=1 Tax=Lentinula lateritia TaxID=40482 RepID=A0ABQ8V3L6_9AGAR|nr:hypothetical protein C8R41DRAFT_589352 [Lentinula lateritia]